MTEDSDSWNVSCINSQIFLNNFVKLLSIADFSNNEKSMLEPSNKNPIEKPSVYDLNLNNFQCHVPLRISEILEIDPTELESSMKIRSAGLHIKNNDITILSNRHLDQLVMLNFCCYHVPRVNSYIEVIGDLEFNSKPIIYVYSWNYLKEIQYQKMDFLIHNLKYRVQYHNMQLKRNAEVRKELREQKLSKNKVLYESKFLDEKHCLEISDEDRLKLLDEDHGDFFNGNRYKVVDKVRLEHLDEVRSKILDKIRAELLDKVRSQHLDKVQSQHLDENRSKVLNEIRSRILNEVQSQILDKNRSEIPKEDHAKILDEIRSGLFDEIISELDEISAEILDNDRTVVWDNVPSEISDEIRTEISDEIRSEISDEEQFEINDENFDRSKFLDKPPSKASNKGQSKIPVANQLDIVNELRNTGHEILSGSFDKVRSKILNNVPLQISDKGRTEMLNGNQLNILNNVQLETGDEILSGSSDVKSEILDKNQFEILNETCLDIGEEILSGISDDVRSEILNENLSKTANKVLEEILDEKICVQKDTVSNSSENLKETDRFENNILPENDIVDEELNTTQYLNEKYINQIKKGETPVKPQILIENSIASPDIIELSSDDEEKTSTVTIVVYVNKVNEKLKHEKLKTRKLNQEQHISSPISVKPNKIKNFTLNSPEKRSNQVKSKEMLLKTETQKLIRKNLGIPYRQKRKSVDYSCSEEEVLKDSEIKKRSKKPRSNKNPTVAKDHIVELEDNTKIQNHRVLKDDDVDVDENFDSKGQKCWKKRRFLEVSKECNVKYETYLGKQKEKLRNAISSGSKDDKVELENDSGTQKSSEKPQFDRINPRILKDLNVEFGNDSEIQKRSEKSRFDKIKPRVSKDLNIDLENDSEIPKCSEKSRFQKINPRVSKDLNVELENSETKKHSIKLRFDKNINPRITKGLNLIEIQKYSEKLRFNNIDGIVLKDHNVVNDKNLHSNGQKCLKKLQFSDKIQATVLENCSVQAELEIIDLEDDKNTSMIINDGRKSLDRKTSRYSDIDLFEEASFSKQNFIVDSSDISIKSADVSADLFDDD